MDQEPKAENAFDDFLDRLLRGERVDAEDFVATHAELSADERSQIRRLCGGTTSAESAGPGESRNAAAGAQAMGEDLPPVSHLGGLRLIRRIGSGGMGAVFFAEDEALGRPTAVKILAPEILGGPERIERFQREARTVAKLRHPNIVVVHSVGEEHGLRYLAMEYVAGESLAGELATASSKGRRLPVDDVLRIGAEIARALAAAHAAGVVHRDVKPSNIRLAPDGRAVLLDFGIAFDAGAAALTATGAFCGSPQYAAPEQVDAARGPIDARTDVYSLGATLYEALTGVAPFRGETREQLFRAILDQEPVPLRKLAPGVSRDVETVVHAALDKSPLRRHPTAAALAADLEAARVGDPISVRRISPLGRALRFARRRRTATALLLLAAIGFSVAATLAVRQWNDRLKLRAGEDALRAAQFADVLDQAYMELGELRLARSRRLFDEALTLDPESTEAAAGAVLVRIAGRDPAGAGRLLETHAKGMDDASWVAQLRSAIRTCPTPELGPSQTYVSLPTSRAVTESAPPVTALDHFVFAMLLKPEASARPDAPFGGTTTADAVLDHLRKAVLAATRPRAYLHYELGYAAWRARKNAAAQEIAAAIKTLYPDSPERRYAVGRTLLAADTAAAEASLRQASQGGLRSTGARHYIAMQFVRSGRADDIALAERLAHELLRENPDSDFPRVILGNAHFARNEDDLALAEARLVMKAAPDHPEPLNLLWRVLLRKGEHEECLKTCEALIARYKPGEGCYTARAVCLMHLGRRDEAMKAFEVAVERDEYRSFALCNYARALLFEGRFAESLERVLAARAAEPVGGRNSAEIEQQIALARGFATDEERLKAVRAGTGRPATPEERVRLAWRVCLPQKRFAEAYAMLKAAFDAVPELAENLSPCHALLAAFSALEAGAGRGVDPPADPAARAALRRAGRELFATILAEAEELVAINGDPRDVAALLAPWRNDPKFQELRTSGRMGELSAAEEAEWSELWRRADALPAAPARPETPVSR